MELMEMSQGEGRSIRAAAPFGAAAPSQARCCLNAPHELSITSRLPARELGIGQVSGSGGAVARAALLEMVRSRR